MMMSFKSPPDRLRQGERRRERGATEEGAKNNFHGRKEARLLRFVLALAAFVAITWARVRVVGFWGGVRTTRLSPVWKAPLLPPPPLWFFPSLLLLVLSFPLPSSAGPS